MFDDGDIIENGDEMAGDGIYTLKLQVESTNNPDSYTFYIYTIDKVDNLSDARLDYLQIIR